jgi:hypothetical protein
MSNVVVDGAIPGSCIQSESVIVGRLLPTGSLASRMPLASANSTMLPAGGLGSFSRAYSPALAIAVHAVVMVGIVNRTQLPVAPRDNRRGIEVPLVK